MENGPVPNLVTLSISQNVDQNSNKFVSNLRFIHVDGNANRHSFAKLQTSELFSRNVL